MYIILLKMAHTIHVDTILLFPSTPNVTFTATLYNWGKNPVFKLNPTIVVCTGTQRMTNFDF